MKKMIVVDNIWLNISYSDDYNQNHSFNKTVKECIVLDSISYFYSIDNQQTIVINKEMEFKDNISDSELDKLLDEELKNEGFKDIKKEDIEIKRNKSINPISKMKYHVDFEIDIHCVYIETVSGSNGIYLRFFNKEKRDSILDKLNSYFEELEAPEEKERRLSVIK